MASGLPDNCWMMAAMFSMVWNTQVIWLVAGKQSTHSLGKSRSKHTHLKNHNLFRFKVVVSAFRKAMTNDRSMMSPNCKPLLAESRSYDDFQIGWLSLRIRRASRCTSVHTTAPHRKCNPVRGMNCLSLKLLDRSRKEIRIAHLPALGRLHF